MKTINIITPEQKCQQLLKSGKLHYGLHKLAKTIMWSDILHKEHFVIINIGALEHNFFQEYTDDQMKYDKYIFGCKQKTLTWNDMYNFILHLVEMTKMIDSGRSYFLDDMHYDKETHEMSIQWGS